MSGKFADLVEGVKALNTEEKRELHDLIKKYLIEERRREIRENCEHAEKELKAGKLKFSSDVAQLKRMLAHD